MLLSIEKFTRRNKGMVDGWLDKVSCLARIQLLCRTVVMYELEFD